MSRNKNINSVYDSNKKRAPSTFEVLSTRVSRATGSTSGFLIAVMVIIIWLVTGPIFSFSDTWQLVINTGTTIITFLMVFLIQRSQNKDFIAMHLKLNELIVAQNLANNRLVAVEEISEEDLKILQEYYSRLAELAEKELSIKQSHSIINANEHHKRKNVKQVDGANGISEAWREGGKVPAKKS